MTRVTLVCAKCGHTARRSLTNEPGSRGTHETSSEPALCPKGHGLMRRQDGVRQERWGLQLQPFIAKPQLKRETK